MDEKAELDKAQAKVNELDQWADFLTSMPQDAVSEEAVHQAIREAVSILPPEWHDEDPNAMRRWLAAHRDDQAANVPDAEVRHIEIEFQALFALVNQRMPETWAEFEVFLNTLQLNR